MSTKKEFDWGLTVALAMAMTLISLAAFFSVQEYEERRAFTQKCHRLIGHVLVTPNGYVCVEGFLIKDFLEQ
jgi:hypothetical protein